MTQFNLADELRRGGTGLLAQAVASLWKMRFREQPYAALNEEECARAWLYARQQEAAAVPTGNQAKAPTALDEMRALQEGAQRERPPCGCLACDPPRALNGTMRLCSLCGNKRCPHCEDHRNVCSGSNELDQQPVTWVVRLSELTGELASAREALAERGDAIDSAEARFEREQREHVSTRGYRQHAESQLAESREALARVEAERDEWQRVAEELGDVIRCSSPLAWAATGDMEGAGEWEKMALSALDQAASEAEVTERAPDAPSYWVLERRDLAAPAYAAANSEGYHGWTTDTAGALRFHTQRDADCHRRARGYDDLVVAAEHQDVSNPEATESAPRER